jgi:outer membrane protein assembly factor BamC
MALLVLTTSGCGYLFGDKGFFRDASEDYKKAPEMEVLQVPEGKSNEALQEIYYIPPVDEDMILAGEFEVPRPIPLVAGAADEIVRIQKLGDKSWAIISIAPGQLWPQVRGFLGAAGLQIARADARAGLMETGWVPLEGQTIASRFRFRIEQGVQRGTSELHVLQMSQTGDGENWPLSSDDVDQESEMLRGVAQYVANSTESAPVSMIADQALSAGGRISMQETDQGTTFIRVGLPFDRAWASLARALEASTFEITDRDRSNGVYYVRFIGSEEEDGGGWFDWLYGEEEHPMAGRDFEVNVTNESETSVAIALSVQADADAIDERERQALLVLIKGNIN